MTRRGRETDPPLRILVADGRIGFTGGMYLRRSQLVATKQPHLEQDVHFEIEGPVVEHLQEAVADDWAFATGESLTEEAWFPKIEVAGSVNARSRRSATPSFPRSGRSMPGIPDISTRSRS